MNEYYKRAATELSNKKSSFHYIKEAFCELLPKKSEILWWIISLVFAAVVSWKICFSYRTIELTDAALNILLTVQLALFGVVFTVFSIIVAFFGDSMLKTLSRIEIKNESTLKVYLSYYEKILFLYFINILITLIAIILVKLMDESFVIGTKGTSDIVAFIISFIYYTFSMKVFLEIKSMIYNTIILFRANLSYRFVGFLQDDQDDKEKEEKKQEKTNDVDKNTDN